MNDRNLSKFCSEFGNVLDKIDILRGNSTCLFDDSCTELIKTGREIRFEAQMSDELKAECERLYKDAYDIAEFFRSYSYEVRT